MLEITEKEMKDLKGIYNKNFIKLSLRAVVLGFRTEMFARHAKMECQRVSFQQS